jgi:D-3-phosphoglycerate dehydrogenase
MTTRRPVVGYSERLGPITDVERRLEEQEGAELRRVSLWTAGDIRAQAADAVAVMVGSVEPLTAEALAELRSCRVVVRRGVGVDNVDLRAATALGIPVAFVPDASVQEVSDHALSLLLALERRIFPLDRAVRSGMWQRDPSALAEPRRGIRRLDSLTLGIVGLGRIGAALARKARPSYGALLAHDPLRAPDRIVDGVTMVGFEELLERSDHISLHAPLTPDTYHLIDERALSRMRTGSVLVNTARGGLIDEEALADALTRGHLAGTGLDVTEEEPMSAGSRLLTTTNVIVTGHSAMVSDYGAAELRRRAADAVVQVLRGRRPAWIANAEVLDLPQCRLPAEES